MREPWPLRAWPEAERAASAPFMPWVGAAKSACHPRSPSSWSSMPWEADFEIPDHLPEETSKGSGTSEHAVCKTAAPAADLARAGDHRAEESASSQVRGPKHA